MDILTPPMFPPSLWSVLESVERGYPRTQNAVEAWHRRWGSLVGTAHPGVYTIIQKLQQEQRTVETNIESLVRGTRVKVIKKKDREREARILLLTQERNNREIVDFLRGIAHNF